MELKPLTVTGYKPTQKGKKTKAKIKIIKLTKGAATRTSVHTCPVTNH